MPRKQTLWKNRTYRITYLRDPEYRPYILGAKCQLYMAQKDSYLCEADHLGDLQLPPIPWTVLSGAWRGRHLFIIHARLRVIRIRAICHCPAYRYPHKPGLKCPMESKCP